MHFSFRYAVLHAYLLRKIGKPRDKDDNANKKEATKSGAGQIKMSRPSFVKQEEKEVTIPFKETTSFLKK